MSTKQLTEQMSTKLYATMPCCVHEAQKAAINKKCSKNILIFNCVVFTWSKITIIAFRMGDFKNLKQPPSRPILKFAFDLQTLIISYHRNTTWVEQVMERQFYLSSGRINMVADMEILIVTSFCSTNVSRPRLQKNIESWEMVRCWEWEQIKTPQHLLYFVCCSSSWGSPFIRIMCCHTVTCFPILRAILDIEHRYKYN